MRITNSSESDLLYEIPQNLDIEKKNSYDQSKDLK